MSDRRQVWQTLAELLARLEKNVSVALGQGGANGLGQEIRKLGREQFKANVLVEKQVSQWEQALATVQETQAQQAQVLEAISAERVSEARHELLEAILPALDGLENAIASGQGYMAQREGAPIVSGPGLDAPTDRAMLAGWLDGLRLVRERLLAVLQTGGVTPIPAIGRPFDPYLHVAIGTTAEGEGKPGIIVAEERRGYRSPAGVLRYAEVIVYRPAEEKT